jgi:hypothetical protein
MSFLYCQFCILVKLGKSHCPEWSLGHFLRSLLKYLHEELDFPVQLGFRSSSSPAALNVSSYQFARKGNKVPRLTLALLKHRRVNDAGPRLCNMVFDSLNKGIGHIFGLFHNSAGVLPLLNCDSDKNKELKRRDSRRSVLRFGGFRPFWRRKTRP